MPPLAHVFRSADAPALLSLEQSRGVIFFSAAYLAETSFTSGSVISWFAVYQSEMIFHALPSHCWTRPSARLHDRRR